MLRLFLRILLDQRGDTLAITRKTSNTVITASGFNTNYDEIEAVVNALTSTNLAADSVTNVQIAGSVVRTDFGLSQHTDGTLQVDLSATNPGLETNQDGGLRAKVAEMINRASGGLTWGRSGDVVLSSSADTPDGFTDKSSTYGNKFIRINSTALSEAGSDTHDHGAASGSHTISISEMPAHTHTVSKKSSGAIGSSPPTLSSDTDTDNNTLTTGSTGGGSGHTHTISSVDNIPAYVTLKLFQKD